MTDTITAGSILVEEGTHLPKSLLLQSECISNGWTAVKDARSTFEKAIQEAGWTFFFMAGEIKATVFGFDRQKALRAALKRLIADVKSQHCNSIVRFRQACVTVRFCSRTGADRGQSLKYFASRESISSPTPHRRWLRFECGPPAPGLAWAFS